MEKKVALQIQHDQNWQKMLEISATNGFRYISMGFGSSKCFHHEDWGDEITKIKSALDALGLRCVMTHAPYYDLRISADFLDDAMETALLRCVKATTMLGGEIMAIHPRGYYRNDVPVPENGFYDNGQEIPEESFRYNVQNLAPLVNEAVRCGCRIGGGKPACISRLGYDLLLQFPGYPQTSH